MKVSAKQYAEALHESLKGKTKVDDELANFVKLLFDNSDVKKLSLILSHFEKIWCKENGLVEVECSCSNDLSEKIEKQIINYVKKQTSAKNVIVKSVKDKSVVGGVIFQYNDTLIDMSIKNKINNLKNNIIK